MLPWRGTSTRENRQNSHFKWSSTQRSAHVITLVFCLENKRLPVLLGLVCRGGRFTNNTIRKLGGLKEANIYKMEGNTKVFKDPCCWCSVQCSNSNLFWVSVELFRSRSPKNNLKKMRDQYKLLFGTSPKFEMNPLVENDHPELDESEFLNEEETRIYQPVSYWLHSILNG